MRIETTPVPAARQDAGDYFGNVATFLTIETPHDALTINAASEVALQPRRPPNSAATAAWEEVAKSLHTPRSVDELCAAEQALPSAHVPLLPQLADYALASLQPGRPVLDAATELNRRIFDDFRYDSAATTLATPVAEAFALRRGVCQDFAHIMLACLRLHGLAARYVSGYLVTRPPPGRRKLQGADASHAWVAVWTGETGWVDLDPTNNLLPDLEHVTLAWGRDYADVAPVSGITFGGGEHRLQVAVDVEALGPGSR